MNPPQVMLREVNQTDVTDLANLNADPDIRKWLGGCTDPARCESYIRCSIEEMTRGRSWYYSVRDATGQFIGFCTIFVNDEKSGAYELTFGLSAKERRHGYGQATVREAMKRAKRNPKIRSLVARVDEQNQSSRKLMLKFDPKPSYAKAENDMLDRTVFEYTFKLI